MYVYIYTYIYIRRPPWGATAVKGCLKTCSLTACSLCSLLVDSLAVPVSLAV